MNENAFGQIAELAVIGPTRLGEFNICANGLTGGYRRVGSLLMPIPESERSPVSRIQVDFTKEFLNGCRPTRWARFPRSPISCDMKHWLEKWSGLDLIARGQSSSYVSTGAVIVGALELGFKCVPTFEGSRNVCIAVNRDDVTARLAERGWLLTLDQSDVWRIKEPELEPERYNEHVYRWAARLNGIPSDPAYYENANKKYADEPSDAANFLDSDPADDEASPEAWKEIADALGVSGEF